MQVIFEHIGITAIWLGILLFWLPPAWLLMRILTPKLLVERYFKSPHFTSAELALFSHFPGTLMRTGIFMNLCVWPKKGVKRQMADVIDHVPKWYAIASKLFVFLLIIHGFSFFFLLLLSYGHILIVNPQVA